jgi:hypothetical protein
MTKKALLLGAGFSKNFGGFLADEVFLKIFNHPNLTKQLRSYVETFVDNSDFEQLYEDILEDKQNQFSIAEKDIIKEVILAIYKEIDAKIQLNIFSTQAPFSYLKTISFIINNFSPENNGVGYVFSLNQDLLLERLFADYLKKLEFYRPGGWNGEIQGALLPFYGPIETPFFKYHKDDSRANASFQSFENLNQETIDKWLENSNKSLYRKLPYLVKLHGSYYWRKLQDGKEAVWIVGKNKEQKIQQTPLLKLYFDKFAEIIQSPGLDLYVFGYSFRDHHINDIIFNACKQGLRLIVVDIVKLNEWLKKDELKALNLSWIKEFYNLPFSEIFSLSSSEQDFVFSGNYDNSLMELKGFCSSLTPYIPHNY